MDLSDYETNSLQKLGDAIQKGKWSNDGLVQLIELSGLFLNLQTISDYAKNNNISYNGVKKSRIIKTLFGVKFVIDNL